MTESYGKVILMSNYFLENLNEESVDITARYLAHQINEIQLKIALECIEKKGMMPEFDQYLIQNRFLNIWEALEHFAKIHPDNFGLEDKTSREQNALD